MTIDLGDLAASAVYLGDVPQKVYRGDVLIFPPDVEPPPAPVLATIRPTVVGGVPFALTFPINTPVAFHGKSASGGQGGRLPSSGVFGGLGGRGGDQAGTFTATADQVLSGYVGADGGPGYSEAYSQGGEPGGACSQQNIYSEPYQALGGPAGGYTAGWLDDAPLFIIGGGGGGGARGNGVALGGKGGDGGGTVGQDGADGAFTGLFSNVAGKGGKGGTQSAPGAGGLGGRFSNGPGDGSAGCDLGGGSTFRLGSYGTGISPHTCGGGGAGGIFGGGGGGNGTASGGAGGAGGGGGGPSWAADSVTVTTNTRGTNSDVNGDLVLTFLVPADWEIPAGWEDAS